MDIDNFLNDVAKATRERFERSVKMHEEQFKMKREKQLTETMTDLELTQHCARAMNVGVQIKVDKWGAQDAYHTLSGLEDKKYIPLWDGDHVLEMISRYQLTVTPFPSTVSAAKKTSILVTSTYKNKHTNALISTTETYNMEQSPIKALRRAVCRCVVEVQLSLDDQA